ncbi:MAG TPA: glycosyltransferase, partial [Chloroflexia bacterium]|nr:glycosyltransferase [Chloroflexia bacterium]
VAAALGGLVEIVDNGATGFLVRPGDLDGAAEKVSLLLRDGAMSEKMGRAGCERVNAQFLSDQYAATFGRLYRQLEAR